MDTQEDQGETQLPPTEEATTSYSSNAHDSYYNGERYPSAYGWHSNYYPPPAPGPQPPPQFYPSMHSVNMYILFNLFLLEILKLFFLIRILINRSPDGGQRLIY
jgi:hypothetical protein